MRDDDSLMDAVQLGDRDAFGELFERYNGSLIGYFKNRGFWDDSDDLTQAVWLKVFQTKELYIGEGRFHVWLWKVAHRTAIDWSRRRKHRPEQMSEDLTERFCHATGNDLDRMITQEEAQEIQDLLPQLPDEQQMVFSLYVFCGKTLSEIAELMESNLPTTKGRLRLGRNRIRELMGIQLPRGNSGTPATVVQSCVEA